MKPGVTLAMIVREESRCLARCLESVRGAVEDIVVVDTGSTDDTLEIARRFGVRIAEIEWPGAFDEARNVSLDIVETEWTLWLDADEWFADGATATIRRAIQRDEAMAFFLVRRDLYPDGRHGEQTLLRLWRTHESVRFRGVIHERIDEIALADANPGRKIFEIDAALWHDGYQPDPSRGKLVRNLPLLRRELDLRPGQLYYEIELAETLKRLGDPEYPRVRDAIASRLEEAEDQDEPPCRTAGLFLAAYLVELPDSELRSARTDRMIRMARGWFSDTPVVLAMVAQTEIRRGNLTSALTALLEVERMAETGKYDRTISTHPKVLNEALFTNLALVAHRLGRRDVAKRNLERLLAIDPGNARVREALAAL